MPQDAGTPAAGRLIDLGPTLGDGPSAAHRDSAGPTSWPPRTERLRRAGDGWQRRRTAPVPRRSSPRCTRSRSPVRGGPSPCPRSRSSATTRSPSTWRSRGRRGWSCGTRRPGRRAESSAPRKCAPREARTEGRNVHDVSPPQSDAELPRIVPDGAGFVVLWIARRPEGAVGGDASEPETPGEPRSFGWLEMVRVDERGAVVGPVRGLTQPGGHVSAYDVREAGSPRRGRAPGGRARRWRGHRRLGGRAAAHPASRATPSSRRVEFQTDGLGRGAPTFVDGPVTVSGAGWARPSRRGSSRSTGPARRSVRRAPRRP